MVPAGAGPASTGKSVLFTDIGLGADAEMAFVNM
jgi:hypothetical protein